MTSQLTDNHIKRIAASLKISEKSVRSTLELLESGATIPFIARYRKEKTGSMDEVQIEHIKQLSESFIELEKRRESILESIDSQGKMTPELKKLILDAGDMHELEDLYLPFKRARKTRAAKARENGLEPLAELIRQQRSNSIESDAKRFQNEEVKSIDEALQGARDIIAEELNETIEIRNFVRNRFEREAVVKASVVKSKESEADKYRDYFEFEESLKRIPSHRFLAIQRGENEGFLRVKIEPDNEELVFQLERKYIKNNTQAAQQVELALSESYKRLIFPSIENEFKKLSKLVADKVSIEVFASNLRQLLLAPPLGTKRILAVDPGFVTGCKLVCLDEHGQLLHHDVIYPHKPQSDKLTAAQIVTFLTEQFNIEAIAVGDGTASRETVDFLRTKVKYKRELNVYVVSEDGASIYSASPVAREEFPTLDATVRGSISIGRRLADPLAELVKIDAKSIGVGQYQHDVDQKALRESLDREVISCVNLVGVDLNTASKHLLTYVSGLNAGLAQNIVNYRTENGSFKARTELKKVAKLGPKAFEQAAGFLRIRDGKNPLDNTAVHPEAYPIVEKMAKDLGADIRDLISKPELRKQLILQKYITPEIGLPTLQDIMNELDKPGRDPRPKIKPFEFAEGVREIGDLTLGMELPGIVTNLTAFGAFVDVGVKEDALLHISQITNRFIKHPGEILKIHQYVNVKIHELDVSRKRISLTMLGVVQD